MTTFHAWLLILGLTAWVLWLWLKIDALANKYARDEKWLLPDEPRLPTQRDR